MQWLRRLSSLWHNLFWRKQVERELDEELRCHLELLAEAQMTAGLSPEEARRAARIELGGADQVKEAVRDVHFGTGIEIFWRDVRYAARVLARNPGFAAVATLTLALGIGANSAIFSVLDAALIQPLPYPRPDRLVLIWSEYRDAKQSRVPASGPQLVELRRRSRLLAGVGGIWVSRGSLTGQGDPEQIRVGQVTANFLSLLGVAPQLGRPFAAGEEGPSGPRAIVLSDAFWWRRFGGDRNLIGKAVRLDGQVFTVVGVMPKGFDVAFPSDASVPPGIEVWTPFREDLASQPRDQAYIRTVARLGSGVSLGQAQAELANISKGLRREFREYATQGLELDVAPLHHDVTRDVRPVLLALFGGVAMVVLIGCTNVANLLLARAMRRQKEFSLRSALGASRSRIVTQLLTESLLLSGLGGLLGLAVGWGGLKLLLAMRPASLARIQSAGLSLHVLAFTFGISLLTGALCGLVPVVAAMKRDMFTSLKEGGRRGAPGRARPQRWLVLAEVAIGFVLLIGSGLMVRTFVKLLAADPGFDPHGVLTLQVALPESRYPDDGSRQRLFRRLLEKLERLPGVGAAGAMSHLPLGDDPNWYEYYSPDGASESEQHSLMADHRAILPGFFASMGIAVTQGRDFTLQDDSTHPNVIIVDESLAKRTWPGVSPVGKRLHVTFIHEGSFDATAAEVVGVARHVRYESLTHDGRGQVYVPYLQSARVQLGYTLRSSGDPSALAGPVRKAVHDLDPDLAVSGVRLMEDALAQARSAARFTTVIAAVLAGLALILSAIGIYGILSFSVVQRFNEIGVRIALGGQRRDILWLVVGQALRLVLAGLAVGLIGSLGLTKLLARLLYEVGPHDAPTIIAAALLLFGTGALAAWIPARRALCVDPASALRSE